MARDVNSHDQGYNEDKTTRRTGYLKSHRLNTVFRWCVCLVVSCTLALGGATVFLTKPAQALPDCNLAYPTISSPSPNQTFQLYVGQQFNIPFVHSGNLCPTCTACTSPQFTLRDPFGAAPSWVNITQSGPGMGIFGNPPPTSAGSSYTITFDIATKSGGSPCCWNYARRTITLVVNNSQGSAFPQYIPIIIPIATPSIKYTVGIDTGLGAGTTQVFMDGGKFADMARNETRTLPASSGSHTVTVDGQVPHPSQNGIRFVAQDAQKTASEASPNVIFNYDTEYYISAVTSPPGLAPLSGSGWHPKDTQLTLSAPGTVESGSGTRYQFLHWSFSTGQTSQINAVSFTASAPTTITAVYEKQYELTLISKYGNTYKETKTWQTADKTAEWEVNPHKEQMSGCWGWFGGNYEAVPSRGNIDMDGPKKLTVNYNSNYPWWVLVVIAVAGVGIYFWWNRSRRLPSAPAAAPAEPKELPVPMKTKASASKIKASAKTKIAAKQGFCTTCGDPVEPGEQYCDKCGKKLKGQG